MPGINVRISGGSPPFNHYLMDETGTNTIMQSGSTNSLEYRFENVPPGRYKYKVESLAAGQAACSQIAPAIITFFYPLGISGQSQCDGPNVKIFPTINNPGTSGDLEYRISSSPDPLANPTLSTPWQANAFFEGSYNNYRGETIYIHGKRVLQSGVHYVTSAPFTVQQCVASCTPPTIVSVESVQ